MDFSFWGQDLGLRNLDSGLSIDFEKITPLMSIQTAGCVSPGWDQSLPRVNRMTLPFAQDLKLKIAETLYSFLNRGIVSMRLFPVIVISVILKR